MLLRSMVPLRGLTTEVNLLEPYFKVSVPEE